MVYLHFFHFDKQVLLVPHLKLKMFLILKSNSKLSFKSYQVIKNILSNSKRNQIDDIKVQNLWHDLSLGNNKRNHCMEAQSGYQRIIIRVAWKSWRYRKNFLVCNIIWPIVHKEHPQIGEKITFTWNTQYKKNYSWKVEYIFGSKSHQLRYTQNRWWLWWVSSTTNTSSYHALEL